MRVPDSVRACTGVSLVSVILLELSVYYFLHRVRVLGVCVCQCVSVQGDHLGAGR